MMVYRHRRKMADNDNGNISVMKPNSSSTEDLSEYTDADESISSAPTEFLAEFLSAVMQKNYKTALKYCHLILQYEPHNNTAKEFYPLIVEKLRLEAVGRRDLTQTTTVQGSSGSSSPESYFQMDDDFSMDDDDNNSVTSTSDSESSSENSADDEEHFQGGSSSGDRHSDGTTASYSSLEDDELDTNHTLAQLSLQYGVDNVDLGNGNGKLALNSPVTWEMESTKSEKSKSHMSVKSHRSVKSDKSKKSNTSAKSNSSVKTRKNVNMSSDSESPTEPVSQQLIAELRARVTHPIQIDKCAKILTSLP